jgi:CheY-like chemotaxis protein
LERLFTPFDRLGAETSEVEGTGLGLALSKALVEAMGGALSVVSTPDVGSTFWVELPLAQHPATAALPDAAEAPIASREPAAGAQRRVLYIEDNLPNLELMQQLMTRWANVALLSAMQGRLGLDLAAQHQPDLILLDVHLPDLSGHEVLQLLQDDARTRDIPVVVVSADATDRQIQQFLSAGARAYITKPFDVRRLLAMVEEFLTAPTPGHSLSYYARGT